MLLNMILDLSKAIEENNMYREARLKELRMKPDNTVKSEHFVFHYFYGIKARSIWENGLKSVHELKRSGFAEGFFRPTKVRPSGYPYVWFTNCDYINAVKMPDFMRHPRREGRDQWGVGPGRVIVPQARVQLYNLASPNLGKVWEKYDKRIKDLMCPDKYAALKAEKPCIFGDYFISRTPVPRAEFIRMEWFDLYAGSWQEIQFPDASYT